MKVKRVIIKNIGMIADTTIDLDKPLILFYGDLMQGKTTLLNSVKWAFGGKYPTDIIRHGQAEASVTIVFDRGSLTREWYVTRDGSKTNDRPIVFILDGKSVKRPVDEIKKFLNPYLLDNEFFKNKDELERKKYLVDIFAVDTTELDAEATRAESDARDLRAKVKSYGEIDTREVRLLNVEAAKAEIAGIRADYDFLRTYHDNEIESIREEYSISVRKADAHNEAAATRKKQIEEHLKWLSDNPPIDFVVAPTAPTHPKAPVPPDTAELEAKISRGEANRVLYEAYQARLTKAAEKAADEKQLSDLEAKQRDIKKKKIAKLAEIDTGGIKNLSFDENGNFIYEGTQASMLSTSQIMRLSGELSSLYPEGFGLELIDRAESLGKSIFGFIERAQREEKSILATIVGEKPAIVPENVGVFVVEKGQLI
jgi:DNA repair ATPase RecN